MDDTDITEKLSALAHPVRLAVVRLLVKAGPEGKPAGQLGEAIGIAPNSMTFHLQKLAHVKLVDTRRDGQFIMYSARFDDLLNMVHHLVGACCSDSIEKCGSRCPPNQRSSSNKITLNSQQKGEQDE